MNNLISLLRLIIGVVTGGVMVAGSIWAWKNYGLDGFVAFLLGATGCWIIEIAITRNSNCDCCCDCEEDENEEDEEE